MNIPLASKCDIQNKFDRSKHSARPWLAITITRSLTLLSRLHRQPGRSVISPGLTALTLGLAAVLYLSWVSPAKFGFYHDDSLYVATGKALAAGDGYTIPSLPNAPPQTKYPPVYPLALALIWKICPRFPQNLTPMLYMSVTLVILFHLLAWGYFRSARYASSWQAFAIIALLSFNFRELILATSLLSEPLYGVLSVVTLWLSETYLQSRYRKTGALLALFIALTLLTRISGIALVIALILEMKRQRITKSGLLILVPAAITFCVWLTWCYTAVLSPQSRYDTSFYTSYYRDWAQVLTDYARQIGQPAAIAVVLLALKNFLMLTVASTSIVLLGLSYQSLPTLWGFPVGLLSIVICFALVSVGFVHQSRSHPGIIHGYTVAYLLLHTLWPYTAYDRFVMPILPFLLLYLVRGASGFMEGITAGASGTPNYPSVAKRTLMTGITLMGFVYVGANYSAGLGQQHEEDEAYTRRFMECDMPTFAWIDKNVKTSEVLVCYQDVKYFLFTGHRAVRTISSPHGRDPGRSLGETIQGVGANYLLLAPGDFNLESRPESIRAALRSYVAAHPGTFTPVFKADRCDEDIFRISEQR